MLELYNMIYFRLPNGTTAKEDQVSVTDNDPTLLDSHSGCFHWTLHAIYD